MNRLSTFDSGLLIVQEFKLRGLIVITIEGKLGGRAKQKCLVCIVCTTACTAHIWVTAISSVSSREQRNVDNFDISSLHG